MTELRDEPLTVDGGAPCFGWPEVRTSAADADLARVLASRQAEALDEDQLVDVLAAHQRLVYAHEARVLALMGELDARRADEGVRDCRGGRDISARSQTVTEIAAATRQPKSRVEHRLHVAQRLRKRLSATAEMFAAGRIGVQHAEAMVDQLDRLVDPGNVPRVEARVLGEATAGNHGPTAEKDLAAATYAQLRASAARAVAEAEPDAHQARHRRGMASRGVFKRTDDPAGDGMGTLTLRHAGVVAEAIYHRLGMIVRNTTTGDDGADGSSDADPRSMDQRVADLAAALLLGQTTVPTLTSEMECGATPTLRTTGQGIAVHVNITMTAATAAGHSDAPALTQGGALVPASLARMIATQPDSTWYRLVTDPLGRMVDLSSKGYRPGAALSRSVETEHPRCVQVGCPAPAEACQCDHEVPWPLGPTAQHNLSPKCGSHHRGKTAGRFHSAKQPDGTITWTYPTGHTYTTRPPRHPVDVWPERWVEPQSLTQVQNGLLALEREHLRRTRDDIDDIKRRVAERRLAAWYAHDGPDPRDADDDLDHPGPTYGGRQRSRPVDAALSG